MTELERLQKEINGKSVVRYHDDWPELGMDAILLWPPGGELISVKPYGYDPEEIYMLWNDEEDEIWGLEHFERKDFCFSTIKISARTLPLLKIIADITDGGIFHIRGMKPLDELVRLLTDGNSSPSCPY